MLGLLETNKKRAENAMQKAQKAKETGAQCLEYLRNNLTAELETALPFSHFKKENARLLTKGSLRLIRFFKARIFEAIK